MKILLTGSTGYIGGRLLPKLLKEGHHVVILVRDCRRVETLRGPNLTVIEGDLLKPDTLHSIPKDIEAAYYLVHSMSASLKEFSSLEETSAHNFVTALKKTACRHLIYLSGIVSDKDLSPHLKSRQKVGEIFLESPISTTVLQAGIIIGSGSASFEIIRDLVEKLPIMVSPKWVMTKCQPIAISDVLDYLTKVLDRKEAFDKTFDIGGPDILTYREMLLEFAKFRGLKRFIITIPVLTPHLSSLWLVFITSTNFTLARTLIESMKNQVVCKDREIDKIVPKRCLSYKKALDRAFQKIKQNAVISSWKDSLSQSELGPDMSRYIHPPEQGCFREKMVFNFKCERHCVIDNIWSIGGENGWHRLNWAWRLRGMLDQLIGGVGLRRGRTHPTDLRAGDALDFWRVIYANREEGRLLLYAEMRLPGEAWLELKVEKETYIQTAIFRPRGVLGRLYWYAMIPFHKIIFKGMGESIITPSTP